MLLNHPGVGYTCRTGQGPHLPTVVCSDDFRQTYTCNTRGAPGREPAAAFGDLAVELG